MSGGPRVPPRAVSTVEVMSDLPFGFSAGEDPDRDKQKKDPDSGSGPDSGPNPGSSDPFGLGSAR